MPSEEAKRIFSKNLRHYLKECGKTQADLYRYMKVSSAAVSDWCNGKTIPRTDKIQSISNWLGLEDMSFLMNEHDYNSVNPYYINPEARRIAQEIHDNRDLKTLMDASRDLQPEQISAVVNLVKTLKGSNKDE